MIFFLKICWKWRSCISHSHITCKKGRSACSLFLALLPPPPPPPVLAAPATCRTLRKIAYPFLKFCHCFHFSSGQMPNWFLFFKKENLSNTPFGATSTYLESAEDKIPLNNFHISGSRHVSYLRISAFPAQCATFCFHVPRLDMILNSRLSTNCKLKKKEYVCLGLLLLAWLQKH